MMRHSDCNAYKRTYARTLQHINIYCKIIELSANIFTHLNLKHN